MQIDYIELFSQFISGMIALWFYDVWCGANRLRKYRKDPVAFIAKYDKASDKWDKVKLKFKSLC
ncbi:hypothetical protein DRT11_23925 [Salmonella enterica subsp. enterica]|nr:hypothetical protein [Salmonella enterica subsp. enterica serovar Bareilly]